MAFRNTMTLGGCPFTSTLCGLQLFAVLTRAAAPGFKRVRIAPQLGNLKWVEGAYPTPLGPIRLRHERKPDGSIKSKIDAPPGIKVESKASG